MPIYSLKCGLKLFQLLIKVFCIFLIKVIRLNKNILVDDIDFK